MSRESKSKTINGNVYTMVQLGAKQGSREFARLIQIAGGAVGGVAAGLTGGNGMGGGIASGLAGLADRITPDQMDHFCDLFSPLCTVRLADGRTPIVRDCFDDHFAGNYGEMLEWLVWCLEINFSSFLLGGGLIESLMSTLKQDKQASESPLASTGKSGASSSAAASTAP